MHFPNAFKWEHSLFCLSCSLPLIVTSANLTRSFGISVLICFNIRNKVVICPSVASSVTRMFDTQSVDFCNDHKRRSFCLFFFNPKNEGICLVSGEVTLLISRLFCTRLENFFLVRLDITSPVMFHEEQI